MDETVRQTIQTNVENRETNLGKMLQVACKNPSKCLALGPYDDYIKKYFDDFQDLSLVNNSELKRLGAPSANGFVVEMPFVKNEYKAYTVLKCATKAESDNLFYEYYVGKFFINNYIKKLPCFVETYDCFLFNNETDWNNLINAAKNKDFDFININDLITKKEVDENDFSQFGESCKENKLLSVLIQHYDNAMTLGDKMDKTPNDKNDIFNILYQVYFGLAYLGNKYTHYDLHVDNILLYKPYDEKRYVTMKFHIKDKIIEFKMEYIAKIIDYGRNYFFNEKTSTDQILENYVCPNTECQPDCGEKTGYSMIQGDTIDKKRFIDWTFPNKPNASHDLRLASSFIRAIKYKRNFGTPEDTTGNIKNITSIYNFYEWLNANLNGINLKIAKTKYDETWKEAAIMEIFDDGRDYTFVVTPEHITQADLPF